MPHRRYRAFPLVARWPIWHYNFTIVAKCRICGAETELYENGEPICLKGDEALEANLAQQVTLKKDHPSEHRPLSTKAPQD